MMLRVDDAAGGAYCVHKDSCVARKYVRVSHLSSNNCSCMYICMYACLSIVVILTSHTWERC